MIRLGLRLTFNSGREGVARLAVIVAAVAIGVGLLLTTLAGINAVHAQNNRFAWLNAADNPANAIAPGAQPNSADPLWWLLQADYYHGRLIGRADVAATGATSPVPPGLSRLPGPGQYFASPAMARLLQSTPADQLGDRYPGRSIGTIGAAALPSPDSLIIIIGQPAAQLAKVPGVQQVTSFQHAVAGGCHCYDIGINTNGLDFILAVVAGAILFPVLIFIGAASRLSTARREQRFAAMRLVGATPQQVTLIAAVESTVAAMIGVAIGFGLFFAVRPAVAQVTFTGSRFYLDDLSLSVPDIVLVALGVPVAAAIAARIALRRVQISPLGVTRRVTPPSPRAYRLLPMIAGVVELGTFVVIGNPHGAGKQVAAFFPGFILIMIGLVTAGPWFTMIGARLMVRRTRRPAVLIAGRRLGDNPQAGFRAISGLVLALFVTAVAVGAITTWNTHRAIPKGGAVARDTLVDQLGQFGGPGQPQSSVPPLSSVATHRLTAISGVTGISTIYVDPNASVVVPYGPPPSGLVSCAQLATTPALGRCAVGAAVATMPPWAIQSPGAVWPRAPFPVARLTGLRALTISVATDGSQSVIERARTVLQTSYPSQTPATTVAEATSFELDTEYQQLADVVILVSLPIAGCSLAASVVAGLNDRKRPFSLLRLTGAPLGVLRRVVALESVVPLLLGAAVATAAGFLAAALFLRSQLNYSLDAPGVEYYVIVVAGVLASLAIIASTLPLLTRITGPETARND